MKHMIFFIFKLNGFIDKFKFMIFELNKLMALKILYLIF